jgi:hypothetical protein
LELSSLSSPVNKSTTLPISEDPYEMAPPMAVPNPGIKLNAPPIMLPTPDILLPTSPLFIEFMVFPKSPTILFT